jgi:hypothetical protein
MFLQGGKALVRWDIYFPDIQKGSAFYPEA